MAASIAVEVSLNGQDFTSSGLHKFTYYDAAAWRAPSTTAPRGGPTEGGTAVRVEMPGLVRALGDPRCRFGRGHNPTVEATVVGEGTEEAHLLCTSPPLWRRSVRGAPERERSRSARNATQPPNAFQALAARTNRAHALRPEA